MKLIHCADFHLDAPLRTNLPPEAARQRRTELLQTFGRMADYAQTHGVSAILIAGDLFDSPSPRRNVADYVTETIEKYPNIHFFYLRGNHDATMTFARIPENLHLFSSEWQQYLCGEVIIHGAEDRRTPADYAGLIPDADACNIVLLHGQAATVAGAESIPLPLLRGRGIDYLALGHIHSWRTESLDIRGHWVCSGCPEGRGFDESGPKGFVLLDVKNRRLTAEFIPFACRTLHTRNVNITGASTLMQQCDRVMEAVAELPAQDMADVVLTGAILPGQIPDTSFLMQQLAGRFFMVRVTDRTRMVIDRTRYQQEVSLKGAFFRLAESDPKLSPEDLDYVLRAGFAALDGDPIPM